MIDNGPPTEASPIYAKVRQDDDFRNPRPRVQATGLFMITVDEGWRQTIVCSGMYEWAADWLLGLLERRAYCPERRP